MFFEAKARLARVAGESGLARNRRNQAVFGN